jgi:hypothetical protein
LKRSTGFPKILRAILLKDWSEYRRAVRILALTLCSPLLMTLGGTPRPDPARGMFAGIALAIAYIIGPSSFGNERHRGTLEYVPALPVKPADLIMAKFLSMHVLIIGTLIVPGLLLNDWPLVMVAIALALFLSTLFMTATVVSRNPAVPQIPLLLSIGAT